jgi:hypothetical protein
VPILRRVPIVPPAANFFSSAAIFPHPRPYVLEVFVHSPFPGRTRPPLAAWRVFIMRQESRLPNHTKT